MADTGVLVPADRNLIVDLYTGAAEETYFKSSLVPDSYMAPYNPDDIYQKQGDYSIYEDMTNDEQVSVCLQLKKDLVIGSGFDFISTEDAQDDIIDFLEKSFEDELDVPFSEQLEEILTAYEFGFSLSEKIFKLNDEQMLTLKCLKTRHPNSWLIHQDKFGNVIKYEQHTSDGAKDINPKSLLHYVNNRRFQNPYGKSDLRNCYAAWFAKRQITKYYAIFLEKSASPIPHARVDKNATQEFKNSLLNVLQKFQTRTALVTPKEVEVQLIEAKSAGEAYARAIDIFNMFIGRSMFIPDLLGLAGSETDGGSYSLGKEQINMFFMHINRRRTSLETLVNRHFIKPIVVYNFGFQEKMPQFKFRPLDDLQATENAKIFLEAVKGKVYKATEEEINHFRKQIKFPEGDVEFVEEAPALPAGGSNFPSGPVDKNGKPAVDPKEQKDLEEKQAKEGETKKTNFAKLFDVPSGDYHKKVDFKSIETKLDDYDNSITNDSDKLIKKIFADLYDQIERKKIIQTQNVSRIDTIKIKYLKELKQLLKGSFLQLYKDAQSQAARELDKSHFRGPLIEDKFLEVLENETFNYVGDWEYLITKEVRGQLVAAIKDERPWPSVLKILDEEGKQLAATSVERYARTKHTEVLNKGRHAYFQDTGVVSGYQYSAVLDDRTSDICRGLHGKKFKAGDEPIPPMHWNCRSVLIPITKYEEFEANEKAGGVPIQEFIEENKGKGFAVK